MGWLLVIGLLHAHLLWSGDILFLYAVCGMLVYPLRHQPPRRLVALGAALLAVGLPLQAYGLSLDFERGWPVWSFFVGMQFNYWPSIAVSLGYVGLVMLVCRTAALRRFTRPFAAVGQTALTNYLLQTILCTTIFYGHGLGWFGSVDRVGQIGVVAGVWALQLIASPLWLRRFRFGPAEWAWRSLTYGVRPPLRRTPVPEPAR